MFNEADLKVVTTYLQIDDDKVYKNMASIPGTSGIYHYLQNKPDIG